MQSGFDQYESSVSLQPLYLEAIQNDMNEIVFEEYNFNAYLRKPASWFSAFEFSENPPEDHFNTSCCTVLDSGFSFSHIMPYLDGKCQKSAVSDEII